MEVKEESVEVKEEVFDIAQDYYGVQNDDDCVVVEVIESAQEYYGVQDNYLEELQLARLSRAKLAKFVHTPFFSKTVVGAFVRIGVGPMPGRPGCNYRIAQIVDVVETRKVYKLEDTITNKGIKLRMGTEDRVYRMEFVTNTEFVHYEFQDWLTIMKRHNLPIPPIDEIRKKQEDITAAENHTYTDDDVSVMIEEKAKFKKTKGELIKLGQKRSGDFTTIDYINKRNRNIKDYYSAEKKIEELDLNALPTPMTEVASTTTPTSTPNNKGRRISLADYKKRKMEAQNTQE